ncbi:MAG: hypothetical protein ABI203_10275, partial [Mucilaginibacter sp.]
KAVRDFFLKRFDEHFPDTVFRIDKSPNGFPVLLKGAEETGIPLSLAHHDRYIAYSFQLDK